MFLTIFKELKNKNKPEKQNIKIDKKVEKENNKKTKKEEKINKKKEKTQKKETKRESKNYRRIPFYKYTKKEKGNSFIKILLSYYTFPVFFIIFISYLTFIIYFTIQSPIYISGHFEKYTEKSSIFIPDLCEVKTCDFFKNTTVNEEDIIYYNYDKKYESWTFSTKKGLKLKILEKNDYYTKIEILNINSFIVDNTMLENFNISLYTDCEIPLKKFGNYYKIYFSFNEGLNNIRNRFGF